LLAASLAGRLVGWLDCLFVWLLASTSIDIFFCFSDVDFLGKERNRFITAMAFGATASSCFLMFFETLFRERITGVSQRLAPKSPYAKGTVA